MMRGPGAVCTRESGGVDARTDSTVVGVARFLLVGREVIDTMRAIATAAFNG